MITTPLIERELREMPYKNLLARIAYMHQRQLKRNSPMHKRITEALTWLSQQQPDK